MGFCPPFDPSFILGLCGGYKIILFNDHSLLEGNSAFLNNEKFLKWVVTLLEYDFVLVVFLELGHFREIVALLVVQFLDEVDVA